MRRYAWPCGPTRAESPTSPLRPLSGRAFKIQNKVDGDCAEKALSAALRGLKAQQVQSPGQRPGCHVPIPYAL